MRKELGVGIIGLGMGRDLLYLNRDASSRLEVRGLCSRDSAKAARVAVSATSRAALTVFSSWVRRGLARIDAFIRTVCVSLSGYRTRR